MLKRRERVALNLWFFEVLKAKLSASPRLCGGPVCCLWASTICLLFLSLSSVASAQTDDSLKPFTMNHREGAHSLVDVSFLLEAPAGKDGFIRVEGSHFFKPDRKRI